ncbi:MAG: DinB family protein [Candidatus Acidiferrales bacterium]
MIGRPQEGEAAPYYFTYINQVAGEDPLQVIEKQAEESLAFFPGISEEASLRRYAPEKWSIRQVLNHVTDTERSFAFRSLWFARGFETPLPSYDQNIAASGAEADKVSWAAHVEEFRRVRLATISLFVNMPAEAWMRRGVASGNPFTVRALAYITAGHLTHHVTILRERYLQNRATPGAQPSA